MFKRMANIGEAGDRRRSSRRALLSLAATGAAAASTALVGCSSSSNAGQPNRAAAGTPTPVPGQEIVGAWHGYGLRQGESTHYVVLVVFHSDGTFNTQGADPTRGPGTGAWQHNGNGLYALTYIGMLFGSDGTYLGVQKVRSTFQLNATRDKLTAQPGNKVDWYDPDGKWYRTTLPGAGVLARISVEDSAGPSQPTFPIDPGS